MNVHFYSTEIFDFVKGQTQRPAIPNLPAWHPQITQIERIFFSIVTAQSLLFFCYPAVENRSDGCKTCLGRLEISRRRATSQALLRL
jgi:hypothetical protein